MVLPWVQSPVKDTKLDFSIGSQLCFQGPVAEVFLPFKLIRFILPLNLIVFLLLGPKRGFKDTHKDGGSKDEK